MPSPRPRLTALPCAALLLLALLAGAPAASADRGPSTKLTWTDCGDGFQCATATVPLDYRRPGGRTLELPVARKPATGPGRRLGSLLVNFGGPGDAAAESLRAGAIDNFTALNDRYDIVAVDPRGTGGTDAIDCKVDQEALGPFSLPLPRPDSVDPAALIAKDKAYIDRCLGLNRRILPYVSTASAARDIDRVRRGLGEDRIAFFGYSYGTFLAATYESLFGEHVGRFVLDGALDADQYINDPIRNVRMQTAAIEVALARFFQACAAHQDQCLGFGGDDPWAAYDELVESMNAKPLPAAGDDPRPVDGDDLLMATPIALYAKQNWPILAQVLALAAAGDGTGVRILLDITLGRQDDGTYDPFTDRFFALSASELRFPRDPRLYFRLGAQDYDLFDHFWFNAGYSDLLWALYPVRARGAYYGPFRAPRGAPTTLVVSNTYDLATPYKGARRLVRELGNARLLTMRGDGHTAYPGNSACIDAAVEAYLEQGVVPPAGTVCRQQVPFEQPPDAAAAASGTASRRALRRSLAHRRSELRQVVR